MSRRPPIARPPAVAAAVLAAALALGGCVTVFPKSDPVQLYRFGVEAPVAAPAAEPAPVVLKGGTAFTQAAANDRILTVVGSETAYIAGARWVAPASVLFDEALTRAFDAPDGARLTGRGEPLATTLVLRLDVRSFEARYENGREAAPTAVVSVRASLIRVRDRALVGERAFEARRPAADNRVGAIVAAYDDAVGEVLGQLTVWTGETARAQPAS